MSEAERLEQNRCARGGRRRQSRGTLPSEPWPPSRPLPRLRLSLGLWSVSLGRFPDLRNNHNRSHGPGSVRGKTRLRGKGPGGPALHGAPGASPSFHWDDPDLHSSPDDWSTSPWCWRGPHPRFANLGREGIDGGESRTLSACPAWQSPAQLALRSEDSGFGEGGRRGRRQAPGCDSKKLMCVTTGSTEGRNFETF